MNISVGQYAEEAASRYLIQQGLKLITRNYRCRVGEIDIILRDKQELVFVEVRYRKSAQFGNAAESVNYKKQQKLIRAAMLYLQRYPSNALCRFDVVSVMPGVEQELEINWIRHAFQVG